MATTKGKRKAVKRERPLPPIMATVHERLVYLCRELDIEMDGVSPIPETAAAILNGIRRVLNEIDD